MASDELIGAVVIIFALIGFTGVVIQVWNGTLNPLCYGARECCFHSWTYKPRIDNLAKKFDERLFGQHLAHMTILGAIHGHVTNPNPQKPLVLSLHGPAGTGKNHISRLLVESLLTLGMNSRFVTIKMSTKDYPHKERLQQYQEELVQLVRSQVSSCPHHIFIFDEVENMPPGLLDSVKNFLDYHTSVDGISFRKAIFIFRSNLAATAITKHVYEQYKKGRAREDITLLEMEEVIKNAILLNPDAGFYKAKIIDSHLVSHFVPFLPLESVHVRQCIYAEFWERGRQPNPVVRDQVLAHLQFYGEQDSHFSCSFAVKGCKNVAEKVNIVLYEQIRKNREYMHADL